MYLVHWKGHPQFHSTWEPSARLDLLKDIIQSYENQLKTASTRYNSAKSALTTFQTPGSTLIDSPLQRKKLDFENVMNSEKKLSPSALEVWEALNLASTHTKARGVRRPTQKKPKAVKMTAKKSRDSLSL